MKVVMLLALCFGLTTACKKKGQSGLVKFGSSLTGGETCAHESKIVAPSTADQNGSFIEGTLESYVIDYEDGFKEEYYLKDKTGKQTLLSNVNKKLTLNLSGSKVRISGSINSQLTDNAGNDAYTVDEVQILSSPAAVFDKSYNLKAIMVIFDYTNRKTTSHYSLEKGKADLAEISDYLARNSDGQIVMNPDGNGDGQPDVEVVTVNKSFTSSYCGGGGFSKLAADANANLKNHTLSNYTTKIYVAADKSTKGNDGICQYGGVANVGKLGDGTGGQTHIGVSITNVMLHELGHTLGLGHSGHPTCTYCHQICPMGNSFDNKLTHFNAIKSIQLGLFDHRKELEKSVNSDGVYELAAIGLGAGDPDNTPRLLIVNGGSKTCYVEYRQKQGEDADMPSGVATFNAAVTVLTGSLSAGQSSAYQKVMKSTSDSYACGSCTISPKGALTGKTTEVELDCSGSGTTSSSTSGGTSGGTTPTTLPPPPILA